MSVRQYSLYNPVPWTNGGGPIAFAGVGAAENKGIAFGGFCHNIVTLSTISQLAEGARLQTHTHIFIYLRMYAYIYTHTTYVCFVC